MKQTDTANDPNDRLGMKNYTTDYEWFFPSTPKARLPDMEAYYRLPTQLEPQKEDEESILAFLCPDNCPGIEIPVNRWLREADDRAIEALRELPFGLNYLSDEVAQSVRAYDKKVSAVMAYCEAIDSGFTCAIPIQGTEAWIRRYRPHLDEQGRDVDGDEEEEAVDGENSNDIQESVYEGEVSVELTGLAAMRQRRTIWLDSPLSQSAVEDLAKETAGNHEWDYQGMQDETIEVTVLA